MSDYDDLAEREYTGQEDAVMHYGTAPWLQFEDGATINISLSILSSDSVQHQCQAWDVLAGVNTSGIDIERCDECEVYDSDFDAAAAVRDRYFPGATIWFHPLVEEEAPVDYRRCTDEQRHILSSRHRGRDCPYNQKEVSVTESPTSTAEYCEQYAAELRERHGHEVIALGRGIPTTTAELIGALAQSVTGEVFIEIDRGVVFDSGRKGYEHMLLPYLYPVAVRIDDGGDVIIHITDADTAQFGGIADEPPATRVEPNIADTCCGKCPGATCYVDQITGA